MTLRVNSSFFNALEASKATNTTWSNAFKSGLGPTRRVICKRVADAQTPEEDVFATGTTFRDAALTGDMTIVGGVITAYGITSDLTTALAADLSTGKAVLRIQGNGNWIEGTIGLTGSNCDFVFPANPTTTNSIAVSPNMRIAPPPFLPSGTGYPPPALDADAPAYVIIDAGELGAAVEAGRIYFNNRVANWTFQHAIVAENMGDIRVTQSTQSVVYNDIEIGAMLLSTDPRVGEIDGKPLHQVLINYAPTESNWPNYPRQTGATGGGYRRATRTVGVYPNIEYGLSNTFPGPHKIRIFTADNRLLGTMDMPRDGLPVNSAQLSPVPTKTKPLRPHMHCASMQVWESHPPKLNTYRTHIFPGVDSNTLRPSLMKERTATNACYPMYDIAQASDSMGQWYGVSKWAQPCHIDAIAADEASRTDPYLWSIGPTGNPSQNPWSTPAWASYLGVPSEDFGSLTVGKVLVAGWGYEPGSYTMHDMYSGPGGRRVDRGIIPTPIAIHLTDPTWVHLRDNTPISVMVQDWNKGYFNHAVHHFDDVKSFSSVPAQEVMDGKWCYGQTYYNGAETFTDFDHTIPLQATGASTGERDMPYDGARVDANYRMPWNGYSVDHFHNYPSPGWVALLYNSPAHAVSQKFRYLSSILCLLGTGKPDDLWKRYLVRDQGWIFFQEAMMWVLGSDHPQGIRQAQVEARMEAGLNSMYTNIYVPVFLNNEQTMFAKGIRNFGLSLEYNGSLNPPQWTTRSFSLHYYLAHALQVWRQTGFWKVMWDKSQQCRDVLTMIINCLDKACIDYYLDTDGCYSGSVYNAGIDLWMGDRLVNNDSTELCTSWADWLARKNPKAGPLEDLVHTADGTLRPNDVGEQSRMQWAFIRRDYFSDIASSRDIAACCAKVTAWQNAYASRIATLESDGSSKRAVSAADWGTHPALGRILPPTQVEP